MTVGELIDLLEKYPKEHTVYFATPWDDWDIVSDYEEDRYVVLDIEPI